MAISMLKIRRPLGRLIFNMGIAIPGKTVFLIETAPRTPSQYKDRLSRHEYRDRFIFIMGIAILVRRGVYIERPPGQGFSGT